MPQNLLLITMASCLAVGLWLRALACNLLALAALLGFVCVVLPLLAMALVAMLPVAVVFVVFVWWRRVAVWPPFALCA